MSRYENYTPEIPLDDPRKPLEPVDNDNTTDGGRAATRRSSGKGGKKEKQTVKQRVKTRESSTVSLSDIPEKIKSWAGFQSVRLITGIVLGCLGIYLGIAFASFLVTCIRDQSAIMGAEPGQAQGIVNPAGEAGARLSELIINRGYGLGAGVIVIWLLVMSIKELTGRPKFKTVNFTIKCLVAFIAVSLIVGLFSHWFAQYFGASLNWGGWHGQYVNQQVIQWFGVTGGIVLCIMMLGIFVVICLRDIINWMMRIKRARDRRRAEREAAELQARKRREEIEEMARREAEDAARSGEGPETSPTEPLPDEDEVVTFDGEDAVLYEDIPDMEEIEEEPVRQEPEPEPQVTSEHKAVVERETDVEGLLEPVASEEADVEEGETSTPGDSVKQEEEGEVAGTRDETDPMVVNVGTITQAGPAPVNGSHKHLYRFPSAELLRPGVEKISVDATEQLENKEKIRQTLLDFDIPIVSIEATVGPTVTLYEIRPEKGVKIAKIRTLVDDIALSLSAIGVRIIAPIPGKGTVGIEVANKDPQTVSMRTVIQSKKYQETRYKLPVALGCTISNDVYIADLAKMPHLLVAGATGQGKSVGLNALIASLLYCKRPDELKFVMIDPKMVEFSLYAKIESHYLAKIPDADEPIITDMSKVVATLSSLCVEMDDRYQLLKLAQCRNLEEYNAKVKENRLSEADGHKFLPYIVVIVDEFSDLIMTAGKEVEMPIARLAQKARAVGIHVIIATQRPSTNVITGIIKANFPVRIAFKVSSGVDSKTILDTPGAQQLIGRGDMLVSNNSDMVRVQCAFIDTPEVEEICEYIARQPYGSGAYILPEPITTGDDGESGPGGAMIGERDALFEECARVVVMSNTASTSSLQRRYGIGYNRAGKIMDQLEAAGIVGPAQGGKPRAVLVDAVTLEGILGA